MLFFVSVSGVYALNVTEIESRIDSVQWTTPASVPVAPSWYDQKGFVWEIISWIFTNTWRIKTDFVNAFQSIIWINDNVPKWDGASFQEGTIWDVGGNIWIWNPNPTRTLDVAGDINFEWDLYQNGALFSSWGGSIWSVNGTNIYRSWGFVWIGTSTPSSQLHTTGTVRFDGGVMIDNDVAIHSDNLFHRAQYSNYWFFEWVNTLNERGFYLGSGNGSDRVNFVLDAADKLFITWGDVWIGTTDPQAPLHVSGNVMASSPTAENHLTTKKYVDDLVSNAPGKFVDGTNPRDAVYNTWFVWIGTSSPSTQLHATRTVRFDGWVQVDGLLSISSTNSYHSAQYANYWYFEWRNTQNERGFYLGSGNGWNRVNFIMDNADRLYIGGWNVGIGVTNPTAALHIQGNAIAAEPTASNHLTTKDYVDSLVSSWISWKAPVPSGSSPQATYGLCDGLKEGWTTYNESDNIIYLCNGASWTNIGSSAVVPNATTRSPGKIQIAGDITGTWNNIGLKENVVGTTNIVNQTIVDADISSTANIAGTKINADFGSQTIRTTNNIISSNPTQNNHLTTKSYVDSLLKTVWFTGTCKNTDDIIVKDGLILSCEKKTVTEITYSWSTWAWGICAWGGEDGDRNPQQSRRVICTSSNWRTANDSNCTENKPISTRSCVMNAGGTVEGWEADAGAESR